VLMAVDNHQLLVDLSKIGAPLVDPTVELVTWGLQQDGPGLRTGGAIHRRGEHPQKFWDREVLRPYINAWLVKRDDLLADPAP